MNFECLSESQRTGFPADAFCASGCEWLRRELSILRLRPAARRGTELPHACARILLHCDQLDEVIDAEPAANPRHTPGRQGVIGARDVVAHGLSGPAPDKYRAGVVNPIKIFAAVNGQMLRRKTIGDLACFLELPARMIESVAVRAIRGQSDSLRLRVLVFGKTLIARVPGGW